MSARQYLPTNWISGTGTTSATVTIPNQVAGTNSNLIVIDHISASITLGAAGTATLALSGDIITSKTIATSVVASAVAANIDVEWANGLPVWTTSGAATTPETGIIITISGSGTPTAASLFVTYHYEQPSNRRP